MSLELGYGQKTLSQRLDYYTLVRFVTELCGERSSDAASHLSCAMDHRISSSENSGTTYSAVGQAGQSVPGVGDLTRGRSELVLENVFLRQQVMVLSREKKRPPLTNQDRRLLVLLARLLPAWKEDLVIVQPDTLIRWHRYLFKIIWCLHSRTGEYRHVQ